MPLQIARVDKDAESAAKFIDKEKAEAVMTVLSSHGCACENYAREIYNVSGPEELMLDRERLSPFRSGEVKATSAFNMKAKCIIHVQGPFLQGGNDGEEEILRTCYENILKIASEKGCKSIVLHLISCGNYDIPKDIDVDIATNVISEFLETHGKMKIKLVLFNTEFYGTSHDLIKEVFNYASENLVSEVYLKCIFGTEYDEIINFGTNRNLAESFPQQVAAPLKIKNQPEHAIFISDLYRFSQEDFIPDRDVNEVFNNLPNDSLGKLIQRFEKKKGIKGPAVYERAMLYKSYYSKLINDQEFNPAKSKILGLAVGLKLNLEETEQLLFYAGYMLSPVKIWDLVVRYFVVKTDLDVAAIDIKLEDMRQELEELLGSINGLDVTHWVLLGSYPKDIYSKT